MRVAVRPETENCRRPGRGHLNQEPTEFQRSCPCTCTGYARRRRAPAHPPPGTSALLQAACPRLPRRPRRPQHPRWPHVPVHGEMTGAPQRNVPLASRPLARARSLEAGTCSLPRAPAPAACSVPAAAASGQLASPVRPARPVRPVRPAPSAARRPRRRPVVCKQRPPARRPPLLSPLDPTPAIDCVWPRRPPAPAAASCRPHMRVAAAVAPRLRPCAAPGSSCRAAPS